jgi:heme A synthase
MQSHWLHRSTVVLAFLTFSSLITGAAVTSNEERPFYSLGQWHLWLSAAIGLLMIVLAIWTYRRDKRPWLRRIGSMVLGAVIVQAILGLQPLPQAPAVRIVHAFVAQLFFSMTVAMAVCTSRYWESTPKQAEGPSWLLVFCRIVPVLVLLQVALGTLFRHGALGLWPHLLGAFIVTLFILALALPGMYQANHISLRPASTVLLIAITIQVFAGFTLLTMESMDADPVATILTTMIHAASGAITLAATVITAVLIRRCVCSISTRRA